MEAMETTLDELKQVTIDYFVNLQRIKKADTGNNPVILKHESIFLQTPFVIQVLKEAHHQLYFCN